MTSWCLSIKCGKKEVLSKSHKQTPWWYNFRDLRRKCNNIYTWCWRFLGLCPKACICHATFQRQLFCMQSAEWSWQAESRAVEREVYLLLFPVSQKSMWLKCLEWIQNSRGSQARVYPWVLCRSPPPTPSFQQAPCWAHSANSNTDQSFETKYTTLSVLWILVQDFESTACVTGKVKIITLRRLNCSIILIKQTEKGKLPSGKIACLVYSIITFSHVSLPRSCSYCLHSVQTRCCLMQQLCSHTLHIQVV